jgi:hypothetical protein
MGGDKPTNEKVIEALTEIYRCLHCKTKGNRDDWTVRVLDKGYKIPRAYGENVP